MTRETLENEPTKLKRISLFEAMGVENTPENRAMLVKSVNRARTAYEELTEKERQSAYLIPDEIRYQPLCAS